MGTEKKKPFVLLMDASDRAIISSILKKLEPTHGKLTMADVIRMAIRDMANK